MCGNFVNKNLVHFNKVPSLPVNQAMIKTATGEVQKVDRQIYVNVLVHGIELQKCVLIVKNLIHYIIGSDKLTKINFIIDFKNNVNNK